MFYSLLCFGLVLALGIGLQLIYLRPKRKIEQFTQKARKAGYKVKVANYNPLSFFVISYLTQDNRSLEVFKKELNQYDLIVGNLFTKLSIIPTHLGILKDLFNQTSKLNKEPLFVEVYKLLADGGIPLAEGQEWKRKRKIISSVFHFDFLNHMIPVIQAQTEKEFKNMDQTIKSKKSVNLLHSCSRIISSVIVNCFFGTDLNSYSVEGRPCGEFFLHFLNEITEYTQSFQHIAFGMIPYNLGLTKKARNLKKYIKIIHSIAQQVIDKQLVKLKNGEFTQKNMLTTLHENNMLNETEVHDPNKYTKAELIGQFFSFFGAGTDTTTNTLNLILHYLSEKNEYRQKINEQLKDVKELKGQQKLKRMKWTEAVINETLRLGGPGASLVPRFAVEKITAGGLQIPQQTSIIIYTIMNQYKDEYFQKPFEFKPQRWIENKSIQPYVYIPFSAGERNCIGKYLAKMELKILVEKILNKYNFKAKYPIKMYYGFAYATQHGEFQMEIKTLKS